ncbi:MAG: SGNH/GDSL hydrolase family protein [Acidobacteria bacterium]|jgi:lysophospholipase L1-like esterase|nr:SGNH/GDSL hydrolase family protein [Acidobacteriota bacterium]
MKFSRWHVVILALALGLTPTVRAATQAFYLHSGDRVLFYGDSITEQRYYPVAVETYVRTRFPGLQVKFVDSAVGGARVTGNWAVSSEAQSLERDVYPFHPNVVTIMLGMNDAMYQPFKESIFHTYVKGYEYIIAQLQKHLPGVKIVLIEPSPWDDVTHTPSYFNNPDHLPGGYNDTLLHYCAFVRKLGAEHHFMVVDFNTPIVDLLKQAEQSDPKLAQKLIPGRIHPGASTQLFMAQLLLKAWHAPATVSSVSLNADTHHVEDADNTRVTGFSVNAQRISWNQTDQSLPYPIMTLHSTKWPQFPPDPFLPYPTDLFWKLPPLTGDTLNPVAQLVTRDTHMYRDLDSETLQVSGLTGSSYTLKIDGSPIGTFSAGQLADGINLARYQTPMMDQADKVLTAVWHEEDLRFYEWRAVQVALRADHYPSVQPAANQLVSAIYRQKDSLATREHILARPIPHHYVLQLQSQQ